MNAQVQSHDGELVGGEGCTLWRRSWLPTTAPHSALVLVHGYAEHCARYEHVGSWLAERGYAVHAYDHRGHGRSGGHRTHVDSFAELIDDLDIVLARVREEHPSLPLLLLGHSMGGLVVSALLAERGARVDAAVITSPALALPDDFPGWRRTAARWLRRLVPRLRLPSGLDAKWISRDPEVVRAYVADPLISLRMTTSLAIELFDAVERTRGLGAKVRVPMFVLHGGADRVVNPQGSRDFFKGLDVPGSDLRIYPDLYHEILNEPEWQSVLGDITSWLEERVGHGA